MGPSDATENHRYGLPDDLVAPASPESSPESTNPLPQDEDINYGTLTHDCDMGMITFVHDAIARLSYGHRVELGTHNFGRLGWQKPDGAHIILTDERKMKFSPVVVYNQELEHYIKNLQMDLLSELFENDALHESLKTKKLKVANVKKHDP
ncbi:hypothetical protein D1007_27722 [Hordeum vulgare]|nr:hypothetical protein D1007_27722 [Hordeum vulgare]